MMKKAISKMLANISLGILILPNFAISQTTGSSSLPSIVPGLPKINSGVQFCNKSMGDENIWVAINHFSNGKWYREGWWKVPFNDCKTVVSKIENRYIYYYAHNGAGKTWKGGNKYCTEPNVFKIGSGSCSSDRIKEFKELDLKDSSSFRMTLN